MKTLKSISKNLKDFFWVFCYRFLKFLVGMRGKLKAKGEKLRAGGWKYGGEDKLEPIRI
jgi:hypothetical protein